jgi:hypothetical protein
VTVKWHEASLLRYLCSCGKPSAYWQRQGLELSLGSFAWKLSFGVFRFEAFAWELSLWIFRLGTFAWDLSLDIINYIPLGFGYFDWKLLLGIFRLGTFAWDL